MRIKHAQKEGKQGRRIRHNLVKRCKIEKDWETGSKERVDLIWKVEWRGGMFKLGIRGRMSKEKESKRE